MTEKIKIVQNILEAMFEDKGQKADTYEIQCYLEILSNKIALIIPLLHNKLMD